MKKITIFICLFFMLSLVAGCDYADNNIERPAQNEASNIDTNETKVEKESETVIVAGTDIETATENKPEMSTVQGTDIETVIETESELVTVAGTDIETVTETDIEDSHSLDLFLVKNMLEGEAVISDEKTVEWGAEVFKADGTELTKTITILDETFELEYLESVKLPLNGYLVHTYAVKGQQYAKVLFSAETGKIVEYVSIPIKVNYSTEEEYIAFIKEILGDATDIEDFKYDKCTTWHYVFYENGAESTVDEKFHVCGKNERWIAYSFYYDKYLGEVKTLEHISAEFFEDSFSLEIYEFGYEKEQFSILMNKTPELNDNIDSFLNAKTLNDYTVTDFDIKGQVLFFREGKPYIKSVVEVRCARTGDDGEIIQRLEIIAGLSEAEK